MEVATAQGASEDLLTVDEVAALLGVTRSTVTSYKSRGQMPAPDRTYGRTPLWSRGRITDWAAGRARGQRP